MEFIKVLDLVINNPKYIWAAISFLGFLVVAASIVRVHMSSDYHKFNLINLMAIDSATGEASDSKFRLNIAFAITAWAFVYLTMDGKLTEWYVAGFLTAWVLDRNLARNATIEQLKLKGENK